MTKNFTQKSVTTKIWGSKKLYMNFHWKDGLRPGPLLDSRSGPHGLLNQIDAKWIADISSRCDPYCYIMGHAQWMTSHILVTPTDKIVFLWHYNWMKKN